MFFFFLIIHCNGLIDDRLTVNRMGYGIMFDKIGELADSGGITYYTQTWSLIIPNYTVPSVEFINCTGLIPELQVLCNTVNNLIRTVNLDVYKTITTAKIRLSKGLEVVPLANITKLLNSDQIEPRSRRKRKKRSVSFSTTLPPLNTAPPPIPDWLKEDSEQNNFEYFIPGRAAGELFTNIFNMPGSSQIKNAVRNL